MKGLRTVRGSQRDAPRGAGGFLGGPRLFGLLLFLFIPAIAGCDEEGEPEAAADFTLTLFDGGSLRLADHQGAPVIVNFFASWCIPCIAEAPALEAIHGEYAERGVTIIGIAVQDTEAKAREFVAEHGLTFPTGLDEGPIKEAYGVFGVPTTFFIDKEGLIRYIHAGVVTEDLLRYELEKFFRPALGAMVMALALAGCLEEDVPPLTLGVDAPPFELVLVDGGRADMNAPHGNGHVITFMASWCPCSNESIPLMKEAHARFADNDIAFLMIGIQEAESKFTTFVDKWQLPFPAGYDAGDAIARGYGVTAPPTTIFVDRGGKVKRVFYGNIKDKEEEFQQWIGELL